MNSVISLDRLSMNPVSFYLSRLAKERPNYKQEPVDDVKGLRQLTLMGSTMVRLRAAEHPFVSTETLLELSRDRNPEVRLSAAEHPKLPYFALQRLVQDPCLDVRLGLAENPNLPISILEILVKDENPYIEDRARRSLDRRNVYSAEPIPRVA